MPVEPGEPLSEREIEVVRLVAAGCSNKEIATRLVLSPNTVKVHLRNIFAKTGVTSRTELTVWALRQGWVALASSSGEKGPQASDAPAVAPTAITPAATSSSASAPAAESALLRGPQAAGPLPEGEAAPSATALPTAESALLRGPQAAETQSGGEATPRPTAESVLLRGPQAAEAQPGGEAALRPTAESAPGTPPEADAHRLTAAVTPTARHAMGEAAPLPADSASLTPRIKERRPGPTVALLPLPRWPRHRWLALGLGWLVALFILLLPPPRPGESAPNPAPGLVDVLQKPNAAPNDKTARWQERAPMSVRRARLAVAAWEGKLYAIGGLGAEGVTALTERYDPEQDAWETLTPRPLAAANVGAASLSSGVLVPGGCDTQGRAFAEVHLYAPRTDSWRSVAPLPEPRCGYALAVLNDQVYLVGGWDGARYTGSLYRYDAATDRWETLPPALTARGFGGAAVYGKLLYYVGGFDGKAELATCEVYDVTTGAWTTCPRMLQPRGGMSLVVTGAHLYAIGGGWQHYVGFNESYDPKAERWKVVETPIVGEWRHAGVAALGTSLYAVGGWNGDYLNRTYQFDALPFQIYIPVSLP